MHKDGKYWNYYEKNNFIRQLTGTHFTILTYTEDIGTAYRFKANHVSGQCVLTGKITREILRSIS